MRSMISQLEYILKSNNYKIILRDNNQAYTGIELYHRAAQLALFFESKQIKQNDRIAVQLSNSIEFIFCYFACILGGFTIVPINSALPQTDIDYIVSLTKPKIHIKNPSDLKFEAADKNYLIRSNESTIIAIFFTSGTTSRPKGVCHTIENMLANAQAFNKQAGLDASVSMLHCMPMGYMAGFLNTVLCPIMAGGCVVIAPQFSAKEAINLWDPVLNGQTNALWLTPTMLALLTKLNRSEVIAKKVQQILQHLFVGTAPLPQLTKEMFEKKFGVKCLESYGTSEAMLISTNSLNLPCVQLSTGKILEEVKIEVRDDENKLVPNGNSGNLFVSSPFVLSGYLDPETDLINVPLENNFLNTGDYGYIDADNNLFITGRVKDLIIHGGTNVSPRAVEETLLQHKDIQDVAVIGKKHSFWGEEVIAFVILEDNNQFHEMSILEYCKQSMHPDAVPARFEIVKDFPRSSTGKIQKQKLRELI